MHLTFAGVGLGVTDEVAALHLDDTARHLQQSVREVDVATMITGGGEAIADIDTLRHQDQVLGPVASPPTVWRALDELTPAASKRIETARAATRARVWSLIPGGLPVHESADDGWVEHALPFADPA